MAGMWQRLEKEQAGMELGPFHSRGPHILRVESPELFGQP